MSDELSPPQDSDSQPNTSASRGRYTVALSAFALAVLVVVILLHPSWLQAIPAAMTSAYYGLGLVHYIKEMTSQGHAPHSEPNISAPANSISNKWRSIWPLAAGVLASFLLLGLGGGGHSSEVKDHELKPVTEAAPKRELFGFVVHGVKIEASTSLNKLQKELGPEDLINEASGKKLYTWQFATHAILEVLIDDKGGVHQAQAFFKPGKEGSGEIDPEIYANFPGNSRMTLGKSTMTEVRETYGFWRASDADPKNYSLSERYLWGDGQWSYGWSAMYGGKDEKGQGIYLATFTNVDKALNWETDFPSKKVQLMKMEIDE